MAAFRASLALPIEQLECDVHLSADGEAVVIHDATLERTTEARGPVAAQQAAALARLRLRGAGGGALPRLPEALALFVGSPVQPRIEVKADAGGLPYPGLVERVLRDLDEAGLRGRAWLIGFDAPVMAAALGAGLAGVAWLVEARSWRELGARGAAAVARAYGFPEIGLPEAVLDAEGLGVLRGAGLGVSVWGANHAPAIRRMLALGVNLLATDDPPLAIALREGG